MDHSSVCGQELDFLHTCTLHISLLKHMRDVPSLSFTVLYCIIKMMRCVATVGMQHPLIWHHRLRLAEIPVMCLTACVIGVWLAGIAKCRSISSKFPIKERLPGPCSQIASGCSVDRQTGEHFAHSSFFRCYVLYIALGQYSRQSISHTAGRIIKNTLRNLGPAN